MKTKLTLAAGAAAIALVNGFAAAQETTGAIRGVVTDDSGSPISGATVTISDSNTGFNRTSRTNADGGFQLRNLSVGGSYTVTARAAGFEAERVENLAVNIGESTTLTFDLASGAGDEIVVVGSAASLGAGVATGPSSTFDLDTLETAPAINRSIGDIIRLDPRVYLDETFVDAIQCAGANPRFNSLTVDGLGLNDQFGLNSNGFPTERIPFSYDSIQQVAVELAPFDVEYGAFTACNINAVAKSGTNEFHGSGFFDYTGDSLKGDEAAGVSFDNGDFDEHRFGINVGGPIIKDRLFFFAAYEKLEGANLFGNNTPAGTSISDDDFARIASIASETYGYKVGGFPTSLPVTDEKLLIKLDLNISEQHRAAFTYIYNDGFNNSASDSGSTRLSEANHFYERGAKLNAYSGSLYSDWTDNLSTEVRIAYQKLDNRQNPRGGLDQWGEVQIRVPRSTGGTTTVYLGADDSRHANQLNYEQWTYKANADYSWNNHLFTAGIERAEFDVFNQFIQEVKGEWVFNSIDDFAAGKFADFRYENAARTNNPDDGAAEFGFETSSLYMQDEWQASSQLNIVLGLRADFYTSSDKPAYNANFHEEYGFRNDDNLDGKSVVQPRFGFTYDWNEDFTVRGGIGLFAGGNPNVWISNNYSNNGVTLFECRNRGRSSDCVGGGALTNVNDFNYSDPRGVFFDVPDEMRAAVAAAEGRGPVNALDPDFEIPSEWKYALGFTYDFGGAYEWMGDNWSVMGDVLYAKVAEAAMIKSLDFAKSSITNAPDGRPIYRSGPFNDFLLTNAEDKGQALVLSGVLSKQHDFGLDWSLAYAYTDAEDTNPMTSSVAFSNNVNYTTSDALNPTTATSDYEVPHRFTFRATYRKEFFADLDTKFSLFGELAEGSPYSYTFGNNIFEGGLRNGRQLVYVPTGPSDPRVASAPAEFYAFINSDDCLSKSRGKIIERNSCNDDWFDKFDLKVSQDLPGGWANHGAEVFIVMENVGNFLNSDWGTRTQHGFPGSAELVDVAINSDGKYVYSNFNANADEGRLQQGPSTWEIRFGAKYKF